MTKFADLKGGEPFRLTDVPGGTTILRKLYPDAVTADTGPCSACKTVFVWNTFNPNGYLVHVCGTTEVFDAK